ncbi:hypothetical protein [Parapedobacter sp. DT-150]|uniref:hypothetical protein n=1 Tax=Parapedobacter sp. DT-150 TaxID=3396162 RepID=UPI003F1D9B01
MKKESRRFYIKSFAIIGIVGGSVLCLLIYALSRYKKIVEKPVYTFGVVMDTYVGTKAKNYVKYQYLVGRKVYYGDASYSPHRQFINVGDTCEVVYEEGNPDNKRLVRDEVKLIKIHPKR